MYSGTSDSNRRGLQLYGIPSFISSSGCLLVPVAPIKVMMIDDSWEAVGRVDALDIPEMVPGARGLSSEFPCTFQPLIPDSYISEGLPLNVH